MVMTCMPSSASGSREPSSWLVRATGFRRLPVWTASVAFACADTTTWFRRIMADIHLVTNTGACEARYLRGQKAVILAALEQLDRETTLSPA